MKLSTGEGREKKKKTCTSASRAPTESFYSCHSKCVAASKYSSSEIFSIPRSSHRHRVRGRLTAAMLVKKKLERLPRKVCSDQRKVVASYAVPNKHAWIHIRTQGRHDQPGTSTSKSTLLHKAVEGSGNSSQAFRLACAAETLKHNLPCLWCSALTNVRESDDTYVGCLGGLERGEERVGKRDRPNQTMGES